MEFYASNVGTDNWQEDMLGRDTLDPGKRMRVDLRDGSGFCVFDIKSVMGNGDVYIRRRANVCTITHHRVRADAD